MNQYIKIGEFSKMVNVPPQTIRYYEELGLLEPSKIDPKNGYRYYSQKNFYNMAIIKFRKMLTSSLEELSHWRDVEELEGSLQLLHKARARLENEIQVKKVFLDNLQGIITRIEDKHAQFTENPDLIEVTEGEDLLGVRYKVDTIENWFQFEEALQSLQKQFPNYKILGNNYGLTFIYDLGKTKSLELSGVEELILQYYSLADMPENFERYNLGKALRTLTKTSEKEETLGRLKAYMEDHQLKAKGSVIVSPVINGFISQNEDLQLEEIYIPVK